MIRYLNAVAFALMVLAGTAAADDLKVGITPQMQAVTVETPEGPMEIRRIQDQNHEITGEFAKTSRACPPFCIQPFSPAQGVTTIGEVELIEMLKDPEAIVVDSRTVDWFCNGLWCGQSPTAIRAMIAAGYPAERIFYYRGGMQSWRVLGLSVTGDGK